MSKPTWETNYIENQNQNQFKIKTNDINRIPTSHCLTRGLLFNWNKKLLCYVLVLLNSQGNKALNVFVVVVHITEQ